jgi:hypothetical protein
MAGDSVGMVAPVTTTTASELLFGLVSGVDVVTVAVLLSEPAAVRESRTRIRTTAPEPAGSVPRSAVTMPVVPGAGPVHVPSVV